MTMEAFGSAPRGGRFVIAYEDGAAGRIGVVRGQNYRLCQLDIAPQPELPRRPRLFVPGPDLVVSVAFDDVQGGLELRYVGGWAAVELPRDEQPAT